jgi:hypothetical protein
MSLLRKAIVERRRRTIFVRQYHTSLIYHTLTSYTQRVAATVLVAIVLGKTKRPRAGTSNNGWNSGPNQRRSPHLGRGCSDVMNMHLRPASIEEANHQRLRANVLGHLE